MKEGEGERESNQFNYYFPKSNHEKVNHKKWFVQAIIIKLSHLTSDGSTDLMSIHIPVPKNNSRPYRYWGRWRGEGKRGARQINII